MTQSIFKSRFLYYCSQEEKQDADPMQSRTRLSDFLTRVRESHIVMSRNVR